MADSAKSKKSKICPSDGTKFPERFSHCPQCGAKVEGESATPDPDGAEHLLSLVRGVVGEELDARGMIRKGAVPVSAGKLPDDEDW